MRKTICAAAMLVMSFTLTACNNQTVSEDIWKNAMYTEDTELGSGSKTIQVEVQAEDKSVTFTVNTDKETVGEALEEYELISGEDGAYGLYVKVVNGITADYDVNKSYWSFSKNGEYMQTGVDKTYLTDGENYELIYTK